MKHILTPCESIYFLRSTNTQRFVFDLSLNMSESKQSSTLYELEMSELPQGSPEDLTEDIPVPMKAAQGQWMCNIKRCMFLILLVISSTILISEINAVKPPPPPDLHVVENDAFSYRVYCSHYDVLQMEKSKNSGQLKKNNQKEQLRRRLYQRSSYTVELPYSQDQAAISYDFKNTYVVDMQSETINGIPQLYYCGYTRPFYSNCSIQNINYTCSIPGAMFDLDVNTFADVIWNNNLNSTDALTDDACMASPTSPNPRCQLMVKSVTTKTFDDPTSHPKNQTMVQIAPNKWPVTAHVHGAEVRPTFDGNPVSWFANDGSRGVGAFSLNDTCYYDSFDKGQMEERFQIPPNLQLKRNGALDNRTKVNRYPNIQNPGNLWYHDHAMRLTQSNVKYGLSGLYILRNQTVEKQIGVDISNQKLVMMTTTGWKTQNLNSTPDVVYRFRFLNNNFGGIVYRITFVYGSCSNTNNIPFTIIGADSSLFHQGIYNQTEFYVASAERIEILIKFNDNQKTYSICTNSTPVRARTEHATEHATLGEQATRNIENIQLISSTQLKAVKNKRKDISNVTLSVPFVNFSDPNIPISVKRMRPLMSVNGVSSINGRVDFHHGRSENPTIGTYEDWYLINTGGRQDHPIHIHLINFQVIKVLNLRLDGNKTCTLYELDFIVAAIRTGSPYVNDTNIFPNASDPRNVSYNYLCAKKGTLYQDQDMVKRLQQVNLEDVAENGISGIDVEKKRDEYDTKLFQSQGISTDGGDGKYVTNETNKIKPYYRRWKDTALVEVFKVFVFRIRWAKSSYAGENDSPFHVPVDQLREYPGFVYHCHILFHEDNEMMRPIMLQLPANVKLNPETPCNNVTDYSWATKAQCINKKCPAS